MTNIKFGARARAVATVWCLWLAGAPPACTSSHEERSTETGNPPVIDVSRVALVVTNDGVHLAGQAGAVSPGGATVEVTIVGSGEVMRTRSNADGSFEIALSVSPDVVVEVRASAGDAASPTIYVTRGGAMVGTGAGDSLSCSERTNLASQAMASALGSADLACESAADCLAVSSATLCSDSCGDVVVARRAVASIRDAVQSVEQGLCANFERDGCALIPQPCPASPSGPIACAAGQCTRLDTSECRDCLSEPVSWGFTNNLATNTISGCGNFQRSTMSGPGCSGLVAGCPSDSSASVDALGKALAEPEVQAALTSGTTQGPPLPGGLATRVTVGERSFVISSCSEGPTCAIPASVLRLRDLLLRIADETDCEPAACPPNARYVEDVCVSCGPLGGCAETTARCAIVCSDSSQCTSGGGQLCSPRGICEASPCI